VDSLPYFNSEVELGEVVIYPEVNREEKMKAYAKIEKVMERLEAGEDFAELASTFSDDYGSARDGGNLGWNSRGTFVPEFEAAAYKLEKGGISDIVESQFGYHIIQLIERRGNSVNTRHILVKPELTQADIDLAKNLLDSVRMLVMNDSITFQQAVKKYSDDREQSYSNGGRMVNPKSGDTFFEMADVDADIFFAIDTIEVGEITAPIQFRARTGEPVLRIVQLQSRSIPHKASLREDYSKIQLAAKDSKKNQAFNDWIEDRIKNTYIEIEEPFRSCPNLKQWDLEGGNAAGKARS
jgi:peptidyl-prolyl cis-trans isomerase SurA